VKFEEVSCGLSKRLRGERREEYVPALHFIIIFTIPNSLNFLSRKKHSCNLNKLRVGSASHAHHPYDGLVGAADGRGPPVTLLVADALVVVVKLAAVGVVTEPCDTVPVATPERSSMGLLPEVWGNEVGGGSGVVRVVV
jgi:hypothetical protein